MAKAQEESKKFVVEYKENGKVISRWHYDYDRTKFGPVLVEELVLPLKIKETKPKPKKL